MWSVTENMSLLLILSLLRYREMTSELIRLNCLGCHSNSTALGTRTGGQETIHSIEYCVNLKNPGSYYFDPTKEMRTS